MTRTTIKQTQRVIGLITVMLVVLGANALAFQGGISPLSDYMYKKDYQQYEEIRKETDVQKRADLLVAFLEERPISRVLLYVAQDYNTCIGKLAGSNTARKISMQEALWELVPTDQEITAAEIPVGVDEFRKTHLLPTRKLILTSMAGGYYSLNNFAEAEKLVERAYAISPDKELIKSLYDIAQKQNNEGKIVSYGKKMMDAFPMSHKQKRWPAPEALGELLVVEGGNNRLASTGRGDDQVLVAIVALTFKLEPLQHALLMWVRRNVDVGEGDRAFPERASVVLV